MPCPLVDHLYLLSNEHLLTEDDAAIFDGEEMGNSSTVETLRVGEALGRGTQEFLQGPPNSAIIYTEIVL